MKFFKALNAASNAFKAGYAIDTQVKPQSTPEPEPQFCVHCNTASAGVAIAVTYEGHRSGWVVWRNPAEAYSGLRMIEKQVMSRFPPKATGRSVEL